MQFYPIYLTNARENLLRENYAKIRAGGHEARPCDESAICRNYCGVTVGAGLVPARGQIINWSLQSSC